MKNKIDHIAIKVSDLTEVSQALEQVGLFCKSIEQHDEVGMKIAFLGLSEEKTTIELLEVVDPSSPIVNEPTGLHHVGIRVENIEKIYDKMKKGDRYKLEGEIRQGAHSRIFFFRINGHEEILFECVSEQSIKC
ncbi:MAG: VOC family protein [Candidatus Aminicenantes bacterium]|nr:VOC family protein [Candidatus Aminicenantes bacterium]